MDLNEVIKNVDTLQTQLNVMRDTIYPDAKCIASAKIIYEESKDRKIRSRLKRIIGEWNKNYFLLSVDRKFIKMHI